MYLGWNVNTITCYTHDFLLEESYEIHSLWPSLAVTARQAVKNTPKRLPSVTVRSPLGASPPAMDSQAESSAPTPPMETGGVASDETTVQSVVRISILLLL